MKKITKDFKFYSYFNVVIVFLSSFILFAPMMIYLKEYQNTSGILIREGYERVSNLVSTILLAIFVSCLSIWLFWKWSNDVKSQLSDKLTEKEYKWVLITTGINLLSIILFLVAFFVIWMFPIHGLNEQIDTLNQMRLHAFIGTYVALTLVMLIVSASCITWTNLKLSYISQKR